MTANSTPPTPIGRGRGLCLSHKEAGGPPRAC